jgi:hypothetical protein
MALNSSGPISLGGATVGQSINLELGKSATALASINAADFRALAGIPSGTISIGSFYGKSNLVFFFTVFTGDSEGQNTRSVGVDSSGNIYSSPCANLRGIVNKIGPSGTPLSYSKLINTNTITSTLTLVNSAGEVFLGGENQIVVPRGSGAGKLTTAGAIAWTIECSGGGGGTTTGGNAQKISVDSSGNVYYLHTVYVSNGAAYYQVIAKHNGSTGANIWYVQYFYQSQRNLGITVDSSNNVYFGAAVSSVFYLIKLDSTGAIVLTRSTTNSEWFSAGVYGGQGVTCSAFTTAGAIVCGLVQNGGSRMVKFDTGFNVTWARQLVNPSGNCVFNGSTSSDTNDNYYTCGYGDNGGYQYGILVKYNSAGTLQWQRRIRSSGWPSDAISMQIGSVRPGNSNDIIYVGFNYSGTAGNRYSCVAGLPADGSKTGTYTVGGITFVYEALSFTDTALSLTAPTTTTARTQSSITIDFNVISNATSDSGITISNLAI